MSVDPAERRECLLLNIFRTNLVRMEMDLLNADPIQESNMHKLKRLV